MTYNEFSDDLGKNYGWYDLVTAKCQMPNCDNNEILKKGSALRNFNKNKGVFKCRSCSYTKEGRKKISEATSYKRSDKTKSLMSRAKKEFYKTTTGLAFRAKLSILTAKGHSENKFINTRRQGWYPSAKTNKWMFYGSSYELRLCWLLDRDDSVETYETQVPYNINGRGRCLDFLITYKNYKKAVEVKSVDRCNETEFIKQTSDSSENAKLNGWDYETYTEASLGMACRELTQWADEIRKEITGIDYKKFRMEKDREKSARHYWKHKDEKTISVPCKHCNLNHEIGIKAYQENIEKNGRYICSVENGYIVGKMPKDYLRVNNPHAVENKKKCNECCKVLPFENFSPKKGGDGLMAKCKACRTKTYRERYQQKKGKKNDQETKN